MTATIPQNDQKNRSLSKPPNKPNAPPPIADAIPAELKSRAQWVVWDYRLRDDKWTKVPFNAQTGRGADSTDPATWASFDEAWHAFTVNRSRYAGVGFVFAADDPYSGFDLDNCLIPDPDTGALTIKPEALEWVERFATYTEVSPSLTGLKGICRAKAAHCGKNSKAKVEIYDQARYFTITGKSWHAEPLQIADAQTVADEFCTHYFPKQERSAKKKSAAPSLPGSTVETATTDKRLEKAFAAANGAKIQRLYQGDCSDYADNHSDADLALCSKLAFWSDGSAVELDAMFRRSGLMRQKWDERHTKDGRTYGEMTIEKALASCSSFYQWNRPKQNVETDGGLFEIGTFEVLLRTPKGIARIHEATTAVMTEWGFSASARGIASAIIGQIGRKGAGANDSFELPLVSLGCLLFKLDHTLTGEERRKRLRNIKDQTRLKLKQFLAEQDKLNITFIQYQEGRIERTADNKEVRIASRFTVPGLAVIQHALRVFPQFARKRSGMKRAAQSAIAAYKLSPQIPGRLSDRKPRDNRKICERQTLTWAQKFADEFTDKRSAFLHLAEMIAKLGAEETCDKSIPLPPGADDPQILARLKPPSPIPLPVCSPIGRGIAPPDENIEMHDFAAWAKEQEAA